MSSPGAASRPGVARGARPERRNEPESGSDRALRTALGGPLRRWLASRAQLDRFVGQVKRHATDLGAERDLQGPIDALRQTLPAAGLGDEVLSRTFALVREVARRTLGTPHYDVQIMAGWTMARGMLAEMETGEGKTLAATLPVCSAALAGIPVHVISSNDYLVERDAQAMGPIYQTLGLSVGTVTDAKRDPEVRRAAYACDITYATASQIAFDYLRDGLQRRSSSAPASAAGPALLRGLCFAVVDEADSVLIDEARTPLILSGGVGSADQRRIYRRALRLAGSLKEETDFRLERRAGRVVLTDPGRRQIEELARPLKGFWQGPRRREEWVVRALGALHLFARDHDYLVREEKVQIIDQATGRVAPDRSWEQGLHQLIEVKEGCPVTPEREALARISYQQFFRRYLRLAGMTGTAREVARELWSVYRLHTVVIPTRLPVRRAARGTRVFTTQEAKWCAVVEATRAIHGQGRPVLIGTCSVSASESLSRLLSANGLPHQVLNASQDGHEARIIAGAGMLGRITVATNMAGRGTDIRLTPEVVERGGLHVIATQRSEARRIDRQLFGRCGRQGDPGSFEVLCSLEDGLVGLSYPEWLRRRLARLARRGECGLPALHRFLISLPQLVEERRNARIRGRLVVLEEYLGDLLAFAGPGE